MSLPYPVVFTAVSNCIYTVNKNCGSFPSGCTSESVTVKVLFPSGKLQNHKRNLLRGRQRT